MTSSSLTHSGQQELNPASDSVTFLPPRTFCKVASILPFEERAFWADEKKEMRSPALVTCLPGVLIQFQLGFEKPSLSITSSLSLPLLAKVLLPGPPESQPLKQFPSPLSQGSSLCAFSKEPPPLSPGW